jgi:Ca2+-binding RTX toxin-like protein
VNNVNEAPTAIIASAIKFDENIAAGSTVASLSTTDPDVGNTFTYALVAGTGSTDNAAFTISGNQLKINASPNFEAKSSYKVRVRTADQGGLFREQNLVLAVNNLVEKVTASTSRILAADKDTLELTGTKNIFGMGNKADNWITGNSGKNKLTGGLGKDVLTGAGGVDTFFYGSLKESLFSGFDVITDYAAGEKIGVAFNFEGDDLIASAGSINALSAIQISTLLTSAKFLANTAEAFTVQNISGTFLALNDAVAGFQAGNDALIHLSNYTISVSNPVSII